MKAEALARVIALLVRSRPFRGLLVVCALVGIAAIATTTSVAALKLSPEQVVISDLGSTQAALRPLNGPRARPGEPVPQLDHLTALTGKVEVIVNHTAVLSLQDSTGAFAHTRYDELAMPSAAHQGRLDLVSGSWPTTPGQCVASADFAGQTRPPLGTWKLTVVGTVSAPYEPHARLVMCAPGTWQLWNLSAGEAKNTDVSASPEYYLAGEPHEVQRIVGSLVDTGILTSDEVSLRETLLRKLGPTGPSPMRFLGDRLPLGAIPLALAAVLGALLARWGWAVSRALERAGLPRRPMRRAVVVTAVVGAAMAAFAGGLIGVLAALAIRPALAASVAEQPLSPWQLSAGDLALVALAAGIGAASGCWFAGASGNRTLRQVDAPARPLGVRVVAGLILTSGALALTAVALALTSHQYLWPMMLAALAMVLGGSCLAPVLVQSLGRRIAARHASARTLAGRIITDDAGRWGLVSGAATGLLGLVISLFLFAASTEAGAVLQGASTVPAGTVLIEVTNPDGEHIPAEVLKTFERDLQLSDHVRLTGLQVVVYPLKGVVQFFSSLDDAQKVLGPLSAQATDTLRSGGLVMVGTPDGTSVTVEVDEKSHVELPITPIAPDPAHRLRIDSKAFGLLPAVPKTVRAAAPIWEYQLYQGLSPAQDVAARAWPANTGYNTFQVDSYRPLDNFSLPVWIAMALGGFGLLLVPLLAGVLRREVRELRPLASTLRSIGLPNNWIRPAFTTAIAVTVLPAVVLAIVGPTLVVAILASMYPAVFDLIGVPWWALGGFLAGVLLAGYLATIGALRSLHHKETPVTV